MVWDYPYNIQSMMATYVLSNVPFCMLLCMYITHHILSTTLDLYLHTFKSECCTRSSFRWRSTPQRSTWVTSSATSTPEEAWSASSSTSPPTWSWWRRPSPSQRCSNTSPPCVAWPRVRILLFSPSVKNTFTRRTPLCYPFASNLYWLNDYSGHTSICSWTV